MAEKNDADKNKNINEINETLNEIAFELRQIRLILDNKLPRP